jgi:hypothetical protein
MSGVRCDPGSLPSDPPPNPNLVTALRLHYSDGCTNPLARGITYGPAPQAGGGCPTAPTEGIGDPRCSGNQQHNKYMAKYLAPLGVSGANVQTLAISNTFTYGGIGGTQATTSGGSPQGPLISLHELGHSLGTLADEYPYSARDVPGGPHPNSEPGSFHHSRFTHDEMIAGSLKWFRWLCEESESGGIITARGSTCGPPHESGATRSSNVWRPSEHSIMRWLGNYFDQVGRENMTWRITGRKTANSMALASTPVGQVGPDDVIWLETQHPKFHDLTITWRLNGIEIAGTRGARNLDLTGRGVVAGDVVQVTVADPTEFVRDPAIIASARLTLTRQWTVGTPLAATPVDARFTLSTAADRAVARDEVVYVETTHPSDRIFDVMWTLDGAVVASNANNRVFDLGAAALSPGNHALSATVSDPANPTGPSETRMWVVDNTLPSSPRSLEQPLTSLAGPVEHNVYFGEFDMRLDPVDDQPGFVVGEFRLNKDGWFNYFGFPDAPHGSPFTFSHSGKVVKALTYGNLGTGGMSKAAFEQTYPDFEPGFGTHSIEHRAIDAAGNIGNPQSYKATVLPGGSPACTTVITGKRKTGLTVESGVACVDGARIEGPVTVLPGASIVVSDGSELNKGLSADGANVVHVFGAAINRDTEIRGTTGDVIVAGSDLARLVVEDSKGSSYGVAILGNSVGDKLICNGNDPGVTDFGAPNSVVRQKTGQCAGL